MVKRRHGILIVALMLFPLTVVAFPDGEPKVLRMFPPVSFLASSVSVSLVLAKHLKIISSNVSMREQKCPLHIYNDNRSAMVPAKREISHTILCRVRYTEVENKTPGVPQG